MSIKDSPSGISIHFEDTLIFLVIYLPTQMRFPIGQERVTCDWPHRKHVSPLPSMFVSASNRITLRLRLH